MTEIDLGTLFARMALAALPRDIEKIERNRRYARAAYDSIGHFLPVTNLDPEQYK